MKLKRRPQGVRPIITIKYLRLQIHNMTVEMTHLRERLEIQAKIAASGTAELNEANDKIRELQRDLDVEWLNSSYAIDQLQALQTRHHFLEGYYAGRQEALTGKTHRGAGSGDTPTFQNGRPPAARPWPEAAAAGPAQQARGEIRREPAGRYAPPYRRPMGEIEVTEVSDDTPPLYSRGNG